MAVANCTRAAIHLTGKDGNVLPAVPTIHHVIDRARNSTRMARGMEPACRDNRPRSSTEHHRKTTPDRPTEAGPIYGLTQTHKMTQAMGCPLYELWDSLPVLRRRTWIRSQPLRSGFGESAGRP
jgi:hypothetical protein